MKNKILISLIFALGLVILNGCGWNSEIENGDSYYQKLAKECESKGSPNCCLSSVGSMQAGNYKLKPEEGECPEEMKPNGLTCIDSFEWCEPTSGIGDVSQTDQFIETLCNEGAEKYFMDEVDYSLIYRCGELYRVDPPRYLLDAPRIFVDKNGAIIAECGGMPSENSAQPAKECSLHCEEGNLCLGREIDCSSNLIQYKDACHMENAYRMRDASHCDAIKDAGEKERCAAWAKLD